MSYPLVINILVRSPNKNTPCGVFSEVVFYFYDNLCCHHSICKNPVKLKNWRGFLLSKSVLRESFQNCLVKFQATLSFTPFYCALTLEELNICAFSKSLLLQRERERGGREE